jgi:hypothetical protein
LPCHPVGAQSQLHTLPLKSKKNDVFADLLRINQISSMLTAPQVQHTWRPLTFQRGRSVVRASRQISIVALVPPARICTRPDPKKKTWWHTLHNVLDSQQTKVGQLRFNPPPTHASSSPRACLRPDNIVDQQNMPNLAVSVMANGLWAPSHD